MAPVPNSLGMFDTEGCREIKKVLAMEHSYHLPMTQDQYNPIWESHPLPPYAVLGGMLIKHWG